MSVGVALLQGDVSFLAENKTMSWALTPSLVAQQVIDLVTSFLGMFVMATVALKKVNIFANDPDLMVIAITLCVISTFICLYELFIQVNFFLVILSYEQSTVPRLLAMLYSFLQDLRFWVIFSLFSHCLLSFVLPQSTFNSRRPIRGWLILIPAGLAPMAMIFCGIVTNGIGFYFEEMSLVDFFLFSKFSVPDWSYWIVDGVMATEFMISLVVVLCKCLDSFRGRRGQSVGQTTNFKAANVVFLYVVYHCVEKPSDLFLLASSWSSHQALTTNLYSLLFPLQLIYFYWRSPRPVKSIPTAVVQSEVTAETEMVPFEGGMKDPLLIEWNAAYDRYMERKRLAAAVRLPSTRV